MKELSQKTILTSIKDALAGKDGVVGVIVYGSVARGDFGKDSDVDVFVIITDRNKYNDVNEIIAKVKTKRPVQPVIRSLDELEKTDDTLLSNVLREGKVLYWNGIVDIDITKVLKLSPYVIISFNLAGLRQATKVRFNYDLYGKRKMGGALKSFGGERLGKSSIIVPGKSSDDIEDVFKKYHIEYKKTNIWK